MHICRPSLTAPTKENNNVEKLQKRPWAEDSAERSSDLRGINLSGEDFSNSELPQRDFRRSVLRGTEFINCDLRGANFADADLSEANFRDAKLQDVDFSNANLTKANFHRADLAGVAFIGANLFLTNFREAKMAQTIFANLDMETCIGLDTVAHEAPCSIGVECLYRSGNKESYEIRTDSLSDRGQPDAHRGAAGERNGLADPKPDVGVVSDDPAKHLCRGRIAAGSNSQGILVSSPVGNDKAPASRDRR